MTKCLHEGKLIPEEIVIPLIENRLKESDCRVNGWVLDGFPQTEAQIHLLKSLKIKPSLVCIFEQPETESLRRLKSRRLDPDTGIFYNMDVAPPSDDTIIKRLAELVEDQEGIVKLRMQAWSANQQKVEDAYKDVIFTVQADQSFEQVTEVISDVILNPIF